MEAKIKAAHMVIDYLAIVGQDINTGLYTAIDCAVQSANNIIETKAKDMWMGSGPENDPRYWDEVKIEMLNYGKNK
jgi:hypothetical protein